MKLDFGLTIDSKGDHEDNNAVSSSIDKWESIRGNVLAPVSHAQCDELKLPFILGHAVRRMQQRS
ncbi:hypothetical protein PsorP6_016051 [Peronosclerospora sorghi]|uniref:Uncharacterized protein n=1 Tax=Peronosclerospora sorghi TaxID=230839 RepID=A0ACC0WQC3_9STRA|nr:hypothetical protein PsorP6_016051 [Peronosclerospora sorghi]